MFVCVVLAKENLVCAAAMVCAIVTLIVSIFLCECVCVCVAGCPFRRAGHFREAMRPPQADGADAATSHTECVPVSFYVCPCSRRGGGEPKKKYCVRAYERGSAQKYYCIKFVILHFSCVLLVK